MARTRNYSDEEKAAALEALNLCGGNYAEAERATGIGESTLRWWAKGDGVSDAIFADFAAKKAARATATVRALNARLAEALFDESKIESARYGELVTAFGVTFDKLRLMDSQPTAITESRSDAQLREKAEELLARLVEAGMDRLSALAALREKAPTLSQYVN
jgi:transposase-like protein